MFPYNPATLEVDWSNPDNGFDNTHATTMLGIAATTDSLIYITNNDENHNVLVFKLDVDSVTSTSYRLETGTERIHGITVADDGYVFVTTYAADGLNATVRVYKGIKDEPQWSDLHTSTPVQTIVLPDTGRALDVAVNEDGSLLYVANYTMSKVYLYTGSSTSGYTLHNNFNFEVQDTSVTGSRCGPTGLAFLKKNNLLLVSVDNYGSGTYEVGRFYVVNPNTGEKLDTCDIAQWNYDTFGGVYNNRTDGGKFPFGSGYTSAYGIDVDAAGNVYTACYYGWTIEKWAYSGQLPTIPITVLGVERVDGMNPTNFTLAQNYPNPFNPSTSIEFSITDRANITLSIFNVTGELVTTLVNGAEFESGNYKVSFDASRLASGTYIYSLYNGTKTISKKMTLIK